MEFINVLAYAWGGKATNEKNQWRGGLKIALIMCGQSLRNLSFDTASTGECAVDGHIPGYVSQKAKKYLKKVFKNNNQLWQRVTMYNCKAADGRLERKQIQLKILELNNSGGGVSWTTNV